MTSTLRQGRASRWNRHNATLATWHLASKRRHRIPNYAKKSFRTPTDTKGQSDGRRREVLWTLLYSSATKHNQSKLKLSHYTPQRCWVERRYSSYSFSTSALDGGEWSASRSGRALAPGKGSPVPIVQEAGWAPELVWTQRLEENPLPLLEIEPRSPARPARSLTLCWLSYLGSQHKPKLTESNPI
jgi:hypothetical protein